MYSEARRIEDKILRENVCPGLSPGFLFSFMGFFCVFLNKVPVCREYQEDGQVDPSCFMLLPSGRPARQPGQYGLCGFGSMGGPSHCTWSCGFRMPEDEHKALGKECRGRARAVHLTGVSK